MVRCVVIRKYYFALIGSSVKNTIHIFPEKRMNIKKVFDALCKL